MQEDDAVDDLVVVGGGVALDEYRQVRVRGHFLVDDIDDFFRLEYAAAIVAVQVVVALGIYGEYQRHEVVARVFRHVKDFGAAVGQVDFDGLLVDERGGDHEDDEQDEHDVDVGHDVHLGFEFVSAATDHAGFLGWACCWRRW